MKSTICLRFLGTVQAECDGERIHDFRSRKALALLGYLAVQGQPVPRECLTNLFWEDQPQDRARANLSWVLNRISARLLGCLQADRHTVQFRCPANYWVDTDAFAELTKQGDPTSLAAAVQLYRGGFLEGLYLETCSEFEIWLVGERERWRQRATSAFEALVQYHSRCAEYAKALRFARRLLELEPWHEEMHRQAMRLLAWDGQRGAALAQYETCCRALAAELGVEPTIETMGLCEQIRAGELQLPPEPGPFDGNAPSPSFLDEQKKARAEAPVFVAREPELACLFGFLDAALAGKSQLVFVTGGAGRGKTALLYEFSRRALDRHPDLLLAAGDCSAYSGLGDPYLPFRDVLAMLTGDVEAQWNAGSLTRDHACRLWQMAPSVVQILVSRGTELIGTLLPARELVSRARTATLGGAGWLERLRELAKRTKPEPSGLEQSHLCEQYANVLRVLAAQHPLLILLDDLQWADAASASLLFHLSRRLAQAGSRILIAGAYRPEEVAPGGGASERHPLAGVLGEAKRRFGDISVDLGRVEETESRRFVAAFLDTQPNRLGEDFRAALFRQTGGHPLFTIELLRAMQERGDLVQDEKGCWVEGAVLNWLSLPPRVEAVIEQRVRRLPPDLYEILTVASVEGEAFTAQVLARVGGASERQILRQLSHELEKHHRLVRGQGEVQIGDQYLSRYRFAHIMFQQYLYEDLPPGECRLLHRQVAAALEELYAARTEEIAVHLLRHYAGDVERERHYARLAGERAAAQFANVEALGYLSRALELTPEEDLAERYALLLAREAVYHLQGEREAQEQDLAALEKLASALHDNRRRAEVALRRARYAESTSDFSTAIVVARAAIDLAEGGQARVGDGPDSETAHLQASGYHQWGRALHLAGDYVAARPRFEQALALARAAHSRQVEADSLRSLGSVCLYLGDYAEAYTYYEQALRLHREMDDRYGKGATLNNLGIASHRQGDWTRARTYYEQSLHIFREIGGREGESQVCNNLGMTFRDEGDYVRARTFLEQALCIHREIGDRQGECQALDTLGLVAADLGDYAGARACHLQSLPILHELGYRMEESISLSYLGALSARQGKYEDALEYCQQALVLAQDLGARRRQGFALTNLGHALTGLGQLAEAVDAYQQALALRRELDEPHHAMETLAGLVRIFLAQGDLAQAQVQAEEILEHLETHTLLGVAEDPFRIHLTCYHVLRADASQGPRAQAFLATAYHLLQERAAKIPDEELRRSFLENVAAHREIIREWQEAQKT